MEIWRVKYFKDTIDAETIQEEWITKLEIEGLIAKK